MDPPASAPGHTVFPDLVSLFSQVSAASAQHQRRQQMQQQQQQNSNHTQHALQALLAQQLRNHVPAAQNSYVSQQLFQPPPFAGSMPAGVRDDRTGLESQLQRAVLQMQVLAALGSANPNAAALLNPNPTRITTTGQPPMRGPALNTATSHNASTNTHAEPPSAMNVDALQWLQAAAARRMSAGTSGSSTPESAPFFPALTPRDAPLPDFTDEAPAPPAAANNSSVAAAAREALAQVHASGSQAKSGKSGRREGRGRRAEGQSLQLCKVCESRKQPQHFYNRHKTCKSCQCQINRIARSQHCSRDEAKRQVNAGALATLGGPAAPAPQTSFEAAAAALAPIATKPRTDSCSLGVSAVASGHVDASSPHAGGDNARVASSAIVAPSRTESNNHHSATPEAAAECEPTRALVDNRASRTNFRCDLDHLASVASAMLEADQGTASADEPPAKSRRRK